MNSDESTFQSFSPFLPLDITKRKLPHWKQKNVVYFVTFRLNDSLPKEKLNQWRNEKEVWLKANPKPWTKEKRREYSILFPLRFNEWLDKGSGSCILAKPEISNIVEKSLRNFDKTQYALDYYVIMPNHVHLIVAPYDGHSLSRIIQSWKSFTSHKINEQLGQRGTIWQHESFDHIVRSPEYLELYRKYIKENPSKAKLSITEYILGKGSGVGLTSD